MSASGQLLELLRAIHEHAPLDGTGVSYTQMSAITGIPYRLLMAKTSLLKARGLIKRANPDAPNRDQAFFLATAAGRALLAPPAEPVMGETMVAAAIRARPALAMVWGAA